jgi:hypothetical protein
VSGGQQPVFGHADLVLELGRRRPAAALQRLYDLAVPGVCEQALDDMAQVGLVVDRVAVGTAEAPACSRSRRAQTE